MLIITYTIFECHQSKCTKRADQKKQGYNIKGIIIIISQDAFALSSCNGTKLPLISGSLRADIRTGLLHNIMMPLMLYPCFLFYLHLTESLISCSSNLLAAHSIEFLQEFLGIHFNEFTDIWDRFFICSAILRNNLLDHTKS